MHRSLRQQHRPFNRHAVAIAIALALGGPGLAQAQFYSVSGSVSTAPVNLFPISTGLAVLDLGANRLFVGGNALGSFAALAGAQMTVGQLVAGYGGFGTGSINVSGAGALVQVGGSGRLDIGSWGTGSLNVSGGAIVDAAVNLADCANPGVFCGNNIGNGAGSTANLLVTGAGSELRTLGFFGVGGAQVRTVANGIAPGQYGRKEAFEVHQELKKKGPVKVPREFVFMDRAAIGLGGVFLHLDARLNFFRLFNDAMGNFAVADVSARQAAAMNTVGL